MQRIQRVKRIDSQLLKALLLQVLPQDVLCCILFKFVEEADDQLATGTGIHCWCSHPEGQHVSNEDVTDVLNSLVPLDARLDKHSKINYQTLVNNMRLADVDKAGPEDLVLKWGKKADKKYSDKLFVYVNETLFKRPVYSTLIEVYERNLFDPQVCHADSEMNGFRKAQLQLMFDTWTSTEVFKLAFDYLQNKDFKYATNMKTLKGYLWTLWFGTYSRCKGPYGSSGWEHVFYGEWKGTKVDGHHSWVRYYLQQKAGQIDYHGYYVYVP
ncbi:endoribonuclease XendoU, partial [Teladorsagia circumcincta]